MNPIKLYEFEEPDLSVVDRGECDLKQALAKFEECYKRGLVNYQSAESAMAATSFGLNRSESDFIEISCNGEHSVLIYSDRLFYSSKLARWFGTSRHLEIKGNKELGYTAIDDYFRLDRAAFESKYLSFICR